MDATVCPRCSQEVVVRLTPVTKTRTYGAHLNRLGTDCTASGATVGSYQEVK